MAELSSRGMEADVMFLALFLGAAISLLQEMLCSGCLTLSHSTVKCRLKQCPSTLIFSHLSSEHC